MSDYLPQELILQILHKLPIKSLVCCTCVCKPWHSFIKNPSFISTHLTLTISSNTHLLLFRLCSKNSEYYTLHFDNPQLPPYMLLDFPFKNQTQYFCVIGCFNGIICLVDGYSSYTYTFILWNPLIKKAITLPKPSITFSTHGHYQAFIGFGFDSKTNDYKVLRYVNLVSYEDEKCQLRNLPNYEEGEELSIEVQLYSLNTNSWKSMTCVAPKYEFDEYNVQAFVNGVVHWFAFKRRFGRLGNLVYRNVILGFDMGDEVFREINLPESLAGVIGIDMYVRKYGDSSIAVMNEEFRDPFRCHIWVMKEYGVVGSWTKLLTVGELGGGMPRVLGFRKSGEVLLQPYRGPIVSCDPQSEEVKDLGVRGQSVYSFVDGYVESLILLDNANAVSDASVEKNSTSDESNEIEDESDDSMDAIDEIEDESDDSIDAIDDSSDESNDTSDAGNGTSDDGSDASNDEMEDAVDASDALSE